MSTLGPVRYDVLVLFLSLSLSLSRFFFSSPLLRDFSAVFASVWTVLKLDRLTIITGTFYFGLSRLVLKDDR